MSAVPVLSRSLKYKISVLKGESTKPGFAFGQLIENAVVKIGRGPENDLVFMNDIRMSRNHAEVQLINGQLFIRNVSAKNFVLVDGEKVNEKKIQGEATIQVGEAVFKISVSSAMTNTTPSPSMSLVKNEQKMQIRREQAPGPQANYQAGYQAPPSKPEFRPQARSSGGGSRAKFYGIIAIVLVGGYWFLTSGSGLKKTEVGLRTDGDIIKSIEQSASAIDQIRKQKEVRGEDSLQYRTAQEHYVRGFRDYRNGQYSRAMESFQAALSFFPAHELARKYLMASQKKFDESVKFNMNQGRKYYGKNNFRLCSASFANVMSMIKRTDDKTYREAKQYYTECQLRQQGRY